MFMIKAPWLWSFADPRSKSCRTCRTRPLTPVTLIVLFLLSFLPRGEFLGPFQESEVKVCPCVQPHFKKQTWSRVGLVLPRPSDHASLNQPLGLTVLSSPLYGPEGLLINSPVTSGEDELIAVSGTTVRASQHESTRVYVHAASSSFPSAEEPSGTDRSTFCQRTGACGCVCVDTPEYCEIGYFVPF